MPDDCNNTTKLHPGETEDILDKCVPWTVFALCPSSSLHGHLFEKMTGTHMVPEVVGTIGISSASVGIDQGI